MDTLLLIALIMATGALTGLCAGWALAQTLHNLRRRDDENGVEPW